MLCGKRCQKGEKKEKTLASKGLIAVYPPKPKKSSDRDAKAAARKRLTFFALIDSTNMIWEVVVLTLCTVPMPSLNHHVACRIMNRRNFIIDFRRFVGL